jgi:hypothetical protein
VLIYVENLGAKVTGYVEYVKINSKDKKSYKIEVKEFYLDLIKGQKLIKNHYFKEFWQTVSEYEAIAR